MPLTAAQIDQQRKQAEELLFSGPQTLGFAKGLFFGHFNAPLLFPYPELKPEERPVVEQAVKEVRQFFDEQVDSVAIDRDADIPAAVVAGLGRLGVLGMTAPKEYGGRGFSQLGYCRIMEVIGGHDSSVAVFVNAHHSIGIRALLLFGSEEQKRRFLPGLVSGAVGSFRPDRAGGRLRRRQRADNGHADARWQRLRPQRPKRYITNGGIAQVLTVIARTPVSGSDETKVTAFLVTPDMTGFEVVEASMPKCGIRGTATARLAFHDMFVPKENVLGPVGKGLRIALTVLDFGRTTFGASCTGAAKTCLRAMVRHAKQRRQFKQTLSEFELVKKKIAYAAAHVFAMEATMAECASFIDRGFEDYMLETAMLKVWSTDALWQIVNDTIQVFGGQAYFSNEPYERMMRDARINMIGEGANDVLRAFIAMVGIKPVADVFLGVKNAWEQKKFGTLFGFLGKQIAARLTVPDVPVRAQVCAMRPGHLAGAARLPSGGAEDADEASGKYLVSPVRAGAAGGRGLRIVRIVLCAEPAGRPARNGQRQPGGGHRERAGGQLLLAVVRPPHPPVSGRPARQRRCGHHGHRRRRPGAVLTTVRRRGHIYC